MNDDRPPEGTPEFVEWLRREHAKNSKKIFGDNHKPADFEEGGAIFGNIEDIDKSDAELFPDELEEHSPEDRRKKFQIHTKDKKKG